MQAEGLHIPHLETEWHTPAGSGKVRFLPAVYARKKG